MEFTGIKFNYVEAKKEEEGVISGLNMNVNVDEVKAANDILLTEFTYTVNYAENMGYIRISGTAYFKGKESELAKIEEGWKTEKKIPNNLIQLILNTVNYSASVNGVFIARVLNLAPPIIPPKIQLKKQTKN